MAINLVKSLRSLLILFFVFTAFAHVKADNSIYIGGSYNENINVPASKYYTKFHHKYSESLHNKVLSSHDQSFFLGYDLGDIAVEVRYSDNKETREAVSDHVGLISNSIHTQGFFVNYFYKIDIRRAITPFIGAGVGFSNVKGTFQAKNTLADDKSKEPDFNFSQSQTRYQQAFYAGLSYAINDNLHLDLIYNLKIQRPIHFKRADVVPDPKAPNPPALLEGEEDDEEEEKTIIKNTFVNSGKHFSSSIGIQFKYLFW